MTLSSINSLTLLGAGKMGGALLTGWLANGLAADAVTVIEPHPSEPLQALAAHHPITLLTSAPDVIDSELVVIAIKPQMMGAVLPALAAADRSQATLVSIAAGTTLDELEKLAGAGPTVRVMPNTPAQVGRGMSVGVANAAVPDARKQQIDQLFAAVGKMAWTEAESDIDAVTGVSGSGPAYVFHMVEALAAAGEAAGLSADLAMTLARQTVVGAGELLHQAPETADILRRNVTSPGGTTAAALDVLMADPPAGLTSLMTEAVAAARDRSRELAAASE